MSSRRNKKLPIQRDGIKAENPEKYYEFGDEVGRGKFSVVRECTSKTNGTKYAAKIIKFDSESLKFAIREYDLMVGGKLENKGTVKLHDAYLVRKYLILIMEYASGQTILKKMYNKDKLTEDDVAGCIRQLCEILADLHSKNVIHLDLRPTNIRFNSDKSRELKLLDYNSSRHIANKKAGEVVDVIGDTEFCAPEMLQFEPVLPGSDMWSIAVITHILLSGVSPFFYEDEDLVVKNVQEAKWDKDFKDLAFDSITAPAKDFITKCFVRIPEARLTASDALKHKWLSDEYKPLRQQSVICCQHSIKETDDRLLEEESDDYIEASMVFRTFDEDEYDSPEESSASSSSDDDDK